MDAMKKNKDKEHRSSIKSRWVKHILLSVILVSFFCSAIVIYSTCVRYFNTVEMTIRARNSKTVDTFFSAYNNGDDDFFTLGAYRFVENFLYKDMMEVWVLDRNRKMIVSSSGFSDYSSENMEDYALALTASDRIGIKRLRLDSGEPVMAMTYILRSDSGENYGALRYLVSMKDMYFQLIFITLLVAIAYLLIVVLISMSGMYFISSIVNPVTEICKTTGEIAKGDFSARIDYDYYDDEIGELCSSINNMAHQLSEIDKMKNDFISTVSHEIRTPLTAIKGWGETLMKVGSDRQILDKGLGIIVNETARLSSMVEELLDFSRMQGGDIKIIVCEVDLSALTEDIYTFYKSKAEDEQISLTFTKYDDEKLTILCDRDKIRQVLINVIDNAIKYTNPGGKIEISVARIQKYVKISISDTGCGIPQKDLPHVKEKFYKANNTVRGTGIGLAVADEIVRMHRGELNLSSEVGQGTTVEIILPVNFKEV